ncbi:MAG: hypothetical protein KDK27_06325 [Leptospiraceae bacterium]|nr:hypothetical protein [Leptospiraceae bacterium]
MVLNHRDRIVRSTAKPGLEWLPLLRLFVPGRMLPWLKLPGISILCLSAGVIGCHTPGLMERLTPYEGRFVYQAGDGSFRCMAAVRCRLVGEQGYCSITLEKARRPAQVDGPLNRLEPDRLEVVQNIRRDSTVVPENSVAGETESGDSDFEASIPPGLYRYGRIQRRTINEVDFFYITVLSVQHDPQGSGRVLERSFCDNLTRVE